MNEVDYKAGFLQCPPCTSPQAWLSARDVPRHRERCQIKQASQFALVTPEGHSWKDLVAHHNYLEISVIGSGHKEREMR